MTCCSFTIRRSASMGSNSTWVPIPGEITSEGDPGGTILTSCTERQHATYTVTVVTCGIDPEIVTRLKRSGRKRFSSISQSSPDITRFSLEDCHCLLYTSDAAD